MITRYTESGDRYTGSAEAWEVYDMVVNSGDVALWQKLEEGTVLTDFYYDPI